MDFNLQVKVRNARLLRKIRSEYGTAAEFSRQSGVSQQGIGQYLLMRKGPYKVNGELKPSAMRICEVLNVMPDEIWPKHILTFKPQKTTSELELTADEVLQIAAPSGDAVIQGELLERWASKLNPRELIAIEFAKHGGTYDELAAEFNVSRERARQIQFKALRKMRQEAMRDGAREFLDIAEHVT